MELPVPRLEAMELPVPRFKIDDNYVGEPPKLEVTIGNLNDNVNEQFLSNMVGKYGELEEMLIHYHPETGRHLGLASLHPGQVSQGMREIPSRKVGHGQTTQLLHR